MGSTCGWNVLAQGIVVAVLGVGAGMIHMAVRGPLEPPPAWAPESSGPIPPSPTSGPLPPGSPALVGQSPGDGAGDSRTDTDPGPSPAPVPVFELTAPIPGQREIGTDEAYAWHVSGLAVFIDARAEREYRQGHIPGAISMPPESLRDGRIPALLDPSNPASLYSRAGMQFIVYCGGGDCQASKEVAAQLYSRGFRHMAVYTDGIAGWKPRWPLVSE
jgi:rhodanese-related sulfurtransferase